MAPQQGMALGNFLRYCSQLVELRLEGEPQNMGVEGVIDGPYRCKLTRSYIELTIAYYSLLVLSIILI